jgi:ABC-type uncharacterized transport system substrate-binding protein
VAVVLAACGGGPEVRTVAIVNQLDSLDAIVDSFEEELQSADESIEFIYLDRSLDFEEGVEALLEQAPDVIATLNTPVSLGVGAQAQPAGVPQVFGMVTDPLGSDLVDDRTLPGRNRTGVGLLQIQKTVELTVRATGADAIAVLHQPSDPASVSGLALAEAAAADLGIDIVVIVVAEDDDLDDVLGLGPPDGTDAFLLIGSPFAARNLGAISLVIRTWDIPAASALTVDSLPTGFALGVAPDSGDIGRQMAERTLAILNGGEAGEIPVGVADNVTLIDLDEVSRHSIHINDELLVEFEQILGGT